MYIHKVTSSMALHTHAQQPIGRQTSCVTKYVNVRNMSVRHCSGMHLVHKDDAWCQLGCKCEGSPHVLLAVAQPLGLETADLDR